MVGFIVFGIAAILQETMKKLILLCFLLPGILFVSCKKESEVIENVKTEVTSEVIQKLDALHFNTNGVEVIDFELPDGSTIESFLVEEEVGHGVLVVQFIVGVCIEEHRDSLF